VACWVFCDEQQYSIIQDIYTGVLPVMGVLFFWFQLTNVGLLVGNHIVNASMLL
jgi:hypothetical protein